MLLDTTDQFPVNKGRCGGVQYPQLDSAGLRHDFHLKVGKSLQHLIWVVGFITSIQDRQRTVPEGLKNIFRGFHRHLYFMV